MQQPTPTSAPTTQSTDFWSNMNWGALEVMVGLVGIIVAGILAYLALQRKRLDLELISITPVMRFAKGLENKVQVLLDGKPVQDVYLIIFKLTNSGHKEIVVTDWDRPLSISFEGSGHILSAEITEKNSNSLAPSLVVEGHTATLAPCLLNNGESMTIEFMVNEWNGDYKTDARVVGIKDLRELMGFGAETWDRMILTILGGILFTVGGLSGFVLQQEIPALILMFASLLLLAPFIRSLNERRAQKNYYNMKLAQYRALKRTISGTTSGETNVGEGQVQGQDS